MRALSVARAPWKSQVEEVDSRQLKVEREAWEEDAQAGSQAPADEGLRGAQRERHLHPVFCKCGI